MNVLMSDISQAFKKRKPSRTEINSQEHLAQISIESNDWSQYYWTLIHCKSSLEKPQIYLHSNKHHVPQRSSCAQKKCYVRSQH